MREAFDQLLVKKTNGSEKWQDEDQAYTRNVKRRSIEEPFVSCMSLYFSVLCRQKKIISQGKQTH